MCEGEFTISEVEFKDIDEVLHNDYYELCEHLNNYSDVVIPQAILISKTLPRTSKVVCGRCLEKFKKTLVDNVKCDWCHEELPQDIVTHCDSTNTHVCDSCLSFTGYLKAKNEATKKPEPKPVFIQPKDGEDKYDAWKDLGY